MRYQVVLQWPSECSTFDYENLIAVEDLLSATLSNESCVDGHDIGSGQMNIFILTNDPLLCFQQVKSTLEKYKMWMDLRAAYREDLGTKYTIL